MITRIVHYPDGIARYKGYHLFKVFLKRHSYLHGILPCSSIRTLINLYLYTNPLDLAMFVIINRCPFPDGWLILVNNFFIKSLTRTLDMFSLLHLIYLLCIPHAAMFRSTSKYFFIICVVLVNVDISFSNNTFFFHMLRCTV